MRKNLAAWERWLRVLLGTALIVLSVAVLRGGDTLAYRAGAVAVAVLGLDFIVTGAIGFCPLYHKLGRRGAPHRAKP